jgi:hypothetical protein
MKRSFGFHQTILRLRNDCPGTLTDLAIGAGAPGGWQGTGGVRREQLAARPAGDGHITGRPGDRRRPGVSDIETGPNGNLFVVLLTGGGVYEIYRC